MKLLLLHISDIHFFQGENQILNKKKAIVDVLKNYFSDVKHCVIVVTGDIAFSGKKIEYEQASILFSYLNDSLQKRGGLRNFGTFYPLLFKSCMILRKKIEYIRNRLRVRQTYYKTLMIYRGLVANLLY